MIDSTSRKVSGLESIQRKCEMFQKHTNAWSRTLALIDSEIEQQVCEEIGPSVKSMGEFWLRKFAKYVI